MIEVLKQQFTSNMPQEEKLNRVREFLQIICLKIIYDKGFLNNLAFVGGTALRIIFDMRRFSEDLDFSLINKEGYGFSDINSELMRGFMLYGLKMESRPKDENNVHSAMLKFSGVLKELGISLLAGEKISIKLEVDTNPPLGWNLTSSIVNKAYVLNITHFDLPSMYATKLHACFYRKFTKGRDFYDFIWYLGKKIKPNFSLLNNAIEQTEGKNPGIDETNFRSFLMGKIEEIDFNLAKKDVERFLEDKKELNLFNLKTIKNTIESFY
jgi:predicted nucleotidyltransferase component of viral defense system